MDDALPTTSPDESEDDAQILKVAKERYILAQEAERDDFDECRKVQDFIAGNQWPEEMRREREDAGRPCLVMDHLSQYVRHVVNSGLLRDRDIRVLAMSGDSDDEVADILAGLTRQITQTSTAKVAYETGLRHAVSVGWGYWRVRVQAIAGSQSGEQEIVIRRIREPRMVLMDPFCEYPDGRDSKFCFVFTKMTVKEFENDYPEAGECQSWGSVTKDTILPDISKDSIIVAEYYYYNGDTLQWALCCPNKIISRGIHHGNLIPIIRVVGEEFEVDGKQRKRGLINPSSMDAQRTYNYASSSFTENVALAPLAPWIAAEGQLDQYVSEWKDAHRIPRPYLRYKPTSHQGQPVPPPQRATPAGIPEGWQGMMQNIIQDTQMIMGVSQPNVLGTGGIPVQSGIGIQAQQEPGDVNTFHYIDHWFGSIEQTGRVILAMVPHVYTTEQVVKVVGADDVLQTATLNPNLPQPVVKQIGQTTDGVQKVLSTSYNHMIGRYDVAIATGPSSATKKAETNKLMVAMVQADPTIMQKAPDLVVKSMSMAGGDELADRLRRFLPPGTTDDEDVIAVQKLQQFAQENEQLKQQMAEMEKIILGEREKAQTDLMKAQMKADGDLIRERHKGEMKLLESQIGHEGALELASMKAQVDLIKNERDNIIKLVLGKLQDDRQAQQMEQAEEQLERVDGEYPESQEGGTP